MLKRSMSNADGPAKLQFLDGDYLVIVPGSYVECAVTGAKIPIETLRYWSVDHQEAYAGPEAALARLGQPVRKGERDER